MRNDTGSTSPRAKRAFGVAALATLAVALAAPFAAAGQGASRAASPSAASKAEKDQFVVELKAPAECKAGAECKAEISLASKGEYHINDKYPIKFKAADPAPEGVSFTKALVKREDGQFGEKKGSLPIGFTVAKPGKTTIAGTFSLSVCSDANCVMDKVDLAVDVDVK